MIKALQTVLGVLVVSLLSGSAFGDAPTSLAGRMYANNWQKVEFLTGYVGRVFEGGKETEFSYQQENQIVDFEGDDLKPEFMRSWFIKENGGILVSADGRTTLSLVRTLGSFSGGENSSEHGRVSRADGRIRMSLAPSLPVPETSDIASDLVDVNACPPSFCRGTSRCWYIVSNGSCVVNYCRHTKSCE